MDSTDVPPNVSNVTSKRTSASLEDEDNDDDEGETEDEDDDELGVSEDDWEASLRGLASKMVEVVTTAVPPIKDATKGRFFLSSKNNKAALRNFLFSF